MFEYIAKKDYTCKTCNQIIPVNTQYLRSSTKAGYNYHVNCHIERPKYRGCLDVIDSGPKFQFEIENSISRLDYERMHHRPDILKFVYRSVVQDISKYCIIYYKEEDKEIAFLRVIGYLNGNNINYMTRDISTPIMHKRYPDLSTAIREIMNDIFGCKKSDFNVDKFNEYKLRYFLFLKNEYGFCDERFDLIEQMVNKRAYREIFIQKKKKNKGW